MKKILLVFALLFTLPFSALAQSKGQKVSLPSTYETVKVKPIGGTNVKNVILMIGDGMSLSHIANLWTANMGRVNLENAQVIGLSKTYTADRLITDSAASGTAMASGQKTNYHYLGVDTLGQPLPTIVDYAHQKGLSTGVVVTCRLYDATPSAFLAHNIDRDEAYDIIGDYPSSHCDVIIGGGGEMFENRPDHRNIYDEMSRKGYQVARSLDEVKSTESGRLLAVVAPKDLPEPLDRGNYLPEASLEAIRLLAQNDKGFFLMIEGSQLDDYGHYNDLDLLMQETADFDRTVGEVLKWAEEDGETLVIVTADHETGGPTLIGGDFRKGETIGAFSTNEHSGVFVPVYVYGPGAWLFSGIYENSDIFHRMMQSLRLSTSTEIKELE